MRKPRKNTTKYGENAKVPTQKKSKECAAVQEMEEGVAVQEMEEVAAIQEMEEGAVVQNPTKPTMETIINDSPIRVTRRLVIDSPIWHVVYAAKICTECLLFHLQSTCNAIGSWSNLTGRSAISIRQDDNSYKANT